MSLVMIPDPASPSPAAAATFHPFPRLPPELRLQIWQYSRPYEGPRLRPYRFPQSLDWSALRAQWHDLRRRQQPFNLAQIGITYSSLPSVAQASCESRFAVLHDAFIIQESDGTSRWAMRPFDVAQDVLYLASDSFFRLVRCYDIMRASGSPHVSMAKLLGGVRHVAVHQSMLKSGSYSWWRNENCIVKMLQAIETLYIVCDAPTELQDCLEIQVGEGGIWNWRAEQGKFDYTASSGIDGAEEGWDAKLNEAIQGLNALCNERGLVNAEIRELVVAAKE